MSAKYVLLVTGAAVIGGTIHLTTGAAQRPVIRNGPKLVPVAETRLLMEGLAFPNFRGLEKILKEKPGSVEAWTHARGQALLIGETGNLLMIRPPRNKGEKVWLDRAETLRNRAADLARSLAERNFEKSRKTLTAVASSCNACHQQFRVKTRIVPFAEEDDDQEVRTRDLKTSTRLQGN